MSVSAAKSASYRLPLRRLFWLPLGLAAVLIVLVLGTLVGVSWRSLERLQPIQTHLEHIGRLQDVGLQFEQALLGGLRGRSIVPGDLSTLREAVAEIIELEGAMHPDTGERLADIVRNLGHPEAEPLNGLFQALAQLREVLAEERLRHDQMLAGVARDSATELRLSVILLVVLPVAGLALSALFRHYIKHPLDDLGDLLVRLAVRDYERVPDSVLDGTAKLAQPVFRSYNDLVSRLQELEEEHKDRERALEREVRQATEALLAQSRELGRAERLAAVGAVSAGLAHELRNPLAGVQMACSKLHRALRDGDQSHRIAMVISELKRINALLTEQVDAARHAPEPLFATEVAHLVGELLALVRYQIPQRVLLRARVPADLICVLPAAGLRQALLNLLLNAVQVLGESGVVEVVADSADGRLKIEVLDDGPGFPEDMLQTGVRPFATSRAGGTGLGLAMVRRFVRDHDGDLRLANRESDGARVTIDLPCAQVESGDRDHG